jgi:hypothetical protein
LQELNKQRSLSSLKSSYIEFALTSCKKLIAVAVATPPDVSTRPFSGLFNWSCIIAVQLPPVTTGVQYKWYVVVMDTPPSALYNVEALGSSSAILPVQLLRLCPACWSVQNHAIPIAIAIAIPTTP